MKKQQQQYTMTPWEIIQTAYDANGDPKANVTILPCLLAAIQEGATFHSYYHEEQHEPSTEKILGLIMDTENQHRGTRFWQDMADTSNLSWLIHYMKFAILAAAGRPEEELQDYLD